jgi:hypothetical protein
MPPDDVSVDLGHSDSAPYYTTIRTRLAIPANVAERVVGSPDDDSPAWIGKLEQAVRDDPSSFLVYASDESEVEVL